MEITAALVGAMTIAGLGGVVRGATGFGGAMVMTPVLSVLLSPITAVVGALLLETFAAAPMLPAAARKAHWRTILPICAVACLTAPLGAWLLSTLDPLLARRAIAATVLVFALVLLTGIRYRGKQRLGTSMALGATSGVLVGATSVGAPPVILYLLASSDPHDVTRANLTLFVTIISLAALGALLWRGMLDGPNGLTALLLSPLYLGGVWLGSRLYGKLDAASMRRWTLIFLLVVSTVVLAL
jgi:uncharacterized membrane protein YfcA